MRRRLQTPAENKLISTLTALIRARNVIIAGRGLYRLLAIRRASERERERENRPPRCGFVTLGAALDRPESVLLSGENRCFPVRAEASVCGTRHPLQGAQRQDGKRERGGEEGRRGGRSARRKRAAVTAASLKGVLEEAGWKSTTIWFSLLRNLLIPPPHPPILHPAAPTNTHAGGQVQDTHTPPSHSTGDTPSPG